MKKGFAFLIFRSSTADLNLYNWNTSDRFCHLCFCAGKLVALLKLSSYHNLFNSFFSLNHIQLKKNL